MTSIQLASVAGVVLALLLAYIPGLADWFNALANPAKVTWTGLLLVIVAVGAFALTCAGFALDLGLSLACDKVSAIGLVNALIAALIANQGTYMLLVKPFKKK